MINSSTQISWSQSTVVASHSTTFSARTWEVGHMHAILVIEVDLAIAIGYLCTDYVQIQYQVVHAWCP